jgi:hypothetical protein
MNIWQQQSQYSHAALWTSSRQDWLQPFPEVSPDTPMQANVPEPKLVHLFIQWECSPPPVPNDWSVCALFLGLLRILVLVCPGPCHCYRGHLAASGYKRSFCNAFNSPQRVHSRTGGWRCCPVHCPHFSAYAYCVPCVHQSKPRVENHSSKWHNPSPGSHRWKS